MRSVVTCRTSGADYHLWASLQDTSYAPKVVVIEFNPTIPNNVLFVQEKRTNVHHGASLRALIALGKVDTRAPYACTNGPPEPTQTLLTGAWI